MAKQFNLFIYIDRVCKFKCVGSAFSWVSFVICVGVGFLLGHWGVNSWPSIKQAIIPNQALYLSSNKMLISDDAKAEIKPLKWSSLLPQKEHEVMMRYQVSKSTPQKLTDMTEQILRSIEASTDQSYQEALISTNTVNLLANQMISISGFIVPIDFHDDNSVKNIFLVPYFGACLHFPAPPPNQIIFAQLESGFTGLDITRAYTLIGQINIELFEDPMGTSAYSLNVASIKPFYGQPDDFRQH